MDPSIMKLLEKDEDKTMQSEAGLEVFPDALNRDTEGGSSTSQPSHFDCVPLSQGSSCTSNQCETSHRDGATRHSLQDLQNMERKEGNSSDMELKQHGTDASNIKQENDFSQELNCLPLHHPDAKDAYQPPQAEQDTLQASRALNLQSSDKNPEILESQHLSLQGMTNQQSMQSLAIGISGQRLMAAQTRNQPESSSVLSIQPATTVIKQDSRVPLGMLLPHILPQLDKDRAMQLQTVYLKLRKNEISKQSFVRHLRSMVGEQMLKMALYKFQSQADRISQAVPESQSSAQQHLQKQTYDSSNQTADVMCNAQKLHEVENQADLHGTPGSQICSSSLIAAKQVRDHSVLPTQGLNKQQQQHLHFSQASFPKFANTGNNNNPYSVTNVSSSTATPLKQQPNDLKMRQIPAYPNRGAALLGASTQAMNMMNALKLEMQNSFSEPKRIPGGGLSHLSNSSTTQQSSVQWPWSTNKEQKSLLSTAMTSLKPEPLNHSHDQRHKSQSSSFSSVQVEQGYSRSESSKDVTFHMRSSKMGISTTTSITSSNLLSSSTSSQMDSNTLLNSRIPSAASPIGLGNSGKIALKKPTIGQKKPLEMQGFLPPPSGKKQKVSGVFSDQSIEELNDVTAVSGVNLKEEEEQLFSGAKEDSRVSKASRQAVQDEEERLLFCKIPLQKKLTGIMAKCGLKNMTRDVEKCLSLCVEERMRRLISSLIKISKQRVDIEKSRHRTIVTSDVRQQIMALIRKVWDEREKKQAEVGKLQKENEPEGSTRDDGDKEKDEGPMKSMKANKEENDKMRTIAANDAARAAVGGDDMLSKWQLMAEQARLKRDGGLNVAFRTKSTRNLRDHQEAVKRRLSTMPISLGAVRRVGRNQVAEHTRPRCITAKDVIAVLEREPQMTKSKVIYCLHEKIWSDAQAESS